MKFAKWQKPNSDQTRVYVNGFSDATVYVVDGSTTGHYSENYPEIFVYGKSGAYLSRTRIDEIKNSIDEYVGENSSSDKASTFVDYLSLAN